MKNFNKKLCEACGKSFSEEDLDMVNARFIKSQEEDYNLNYVRL
jgi:hypothetical protein